MVLIARGARKWALLGLVSVVGVTATAPSTASAVSSAQAISYVNELRLGSGIYRLKASKRLNTGCRAHARYMARNRQLVHGGGERRGRPGYTRAGAFPRASEIISLDPWRSAALNPWEDSPFHLVTMLHPRITVAGYGESRRYKCMRFTGTRRPRGAPRFFSYPADGATGVPTFSNVIERPRGPGEAVGIPSGTTTGYNILLFSYNYVPPFDRGADIRTAELVGPSGAVELKWVDAKQDGLLNGGAGVLIPVSPLAANARYTATVNWLDPSDRAVTQTFSFTTGS